ncbi:MAG: hypothetical protein ACXV8I_07810 [Methylobacter sp.]
MPVMLTSTAGPVIAAGTDANIEFVVVVGLVVVIGVVVATGVAVVTGVIVGAGFAGNKSPV